MGKNNKKFSHNFIKDEFSKDGYILLSKEYKNANTKLEYLCSKHKEHGSQYVSFTSFRNNKDNCEYCRSEHAKNNWHKSRNFTPISRDDFLKKHLIKYQEKMYGSVGDEYVILDLFKKNKSVHMKLQHTVCKHIYDVSQHHFFSRNQRCPNRKCNSKIRSDACMKPFEQLKQEVYDLVNDEYKIVGKYTGTNNDISFYHKVCKNIFNKTPHNFLAGQRCPHCVLPTKGEQKIIDYLEFKCEKYTFQKSYDDLRGIKNGLLSYDFYIDNKNILIEYQGQFHDRTAFKNDDYKWYRQQEHDKRKRDYAKFHNIRLLEIWYWDFENIEEILERELGYNSDSLVS